MAALVAVVAMSANGVIGDGKKLLWHIPRDLRRVKALTMHKPLIMGRRTFESLGKPLAGRANIVLTQNKAQAETLQKKGAVVAHTPNQAIELANAWIDADPSHKKEIIIFGGGEIYTLFMPYLTRIEATEINKAYAGNAVFPKISDTDWYEDSRENFSAENTVPSFSYVRYLRPSAQ